MAKHPTAIKNNNKHNKQKNKRLKHQCMGTLEGAIACHYFLKKVSDCLLYFWLAMVLGIVKVVWVHIYVSACAKNLALPLYLLSSLLFVYYSIIFYCTSIVFYRYTIMRLSYCATMLHDVNMYSFAAIPLGYHIIQLYQFCYYYYFVLLYHCILY